MKLTSKTVETDCQRKYPGYVLIEMEVMTGVPDDVDPAIHRGNLPVLSAQQAYPAGTEKVFIIGQERRPTADS